MTSNKFTTKKSNFGTPEVCKVPPKVLPPPPPPPTFPPDAIDLDLKIEVDDMGTPRELTATRTLPLNPTDNTYSEQWTDGNGDFWDVWLVINPATRYIEGYCAGSPQLYPNWSFDITPYLLPDPWTDWITVDTYNWYNLLSVLCKLRATP